MSVLHNPNQLIPGLLLCGAVTLAAVGLQRLEEHLLGRPYLEALVLAILLGTAVRSVWSPHKRWLPGINFSAKFLLELAVMLLGASISLQTILAVGPRLLLGIAGIVMVAIPASYMLGRFLGLPQRIAILIACGNSICGNSAIAAVAPVIHADSDDVASSIAFTAVLGVVVVLALPFLIPLLHLSGTQYGVLAGLTVYAVPQVLAATVPAGLVATQIGTLVKLVRVLMLGPVVLFLSLGAGRLERAAIHKSAVVTGEALPKTGRLPLSRLVPWFILGFLALGALRSADLVPHVLLVPAALTANVLTVIAMAALGLGVDIRVVARAGGRVTTTVVISLLLLVAISLALIRVLGVA
jgi:uncharacterized integral membrane protein (TIGR00698 family)